jgi:chemotaxis protein MotB
MKRMTGLVGVSLCALAALATGCESGTAYQIDAQQERIATLEKEKGQLEADLRAMRMAADAARNRAMELDRELADARRRLAERPEPTVIERMPTGWQGDAAIAWTNIADDILFDSGKATLKNSGRAKLDEVAREIATSFADRSIWVVGHTDTDPIKHSAAQFKDNLDLSQERGATVFRELMKHGLSPTDMVAGGQGEYNPLASNDSKEGKAKNRRVQIIAIAKPAPDRG